MTIPPCPKPAEELVHEIFTEVRELALAGTLTQEVLAVGVMAAQDWLTYLDSLVDAEFEISGTSLDELDQIITEGMKP